MVAQLQPVAQSGILIQTQPKLDDEKGRKSMNRRKGQNGAVVIQSGWYRVRWRMDIEGQEERIHMSETVAPVVIDKDGNPKPASQGVQRLAREIVERSAANSVEHFNRVVFGEVSFRDQTKEYLRWAGSRDRKRIKDLVSVEGVLTCLSSIRRNSAVRRSWRKPSTNLFKKAMAMNRHYIFCLLHPECEFQRRLRSKGEILPTTGVRFRCGSKFTARNPSSSPI